MQDIIGNYFIDISSKTPELIIAEAKQQRLNGRFNIALEIVQNLKETAGFSEEFALLEKSLIKDINQQKYLEHWISNRSNGDLYPKGIHGVREGLSSVISLQKSLISGLKELMHDAINFSCEISIIARDDYPQYLTLREILKCSLQELDLKKQTNHVAIDLVCESYKAELDPDYIQILRLLKEAHPWQIARILRPQKLRANLEIIKNITDAVISNKINCNELDDLQKTNLLAISYTVISNEKYRLLCSALAATIKDQDTSNFTGWKKTWSLGSTAPQPAITSAPEENIRNRKLNIAVCVSGQLRGFKEANLTWDRLGLSNHNTDFYIHTWKNVGVRFPDPTWRPHVERRFNDKNFVSAYISMCAKYGVSTVTELYPSIFSTSSGDFIATPTSIKDAYGPRCVVAIDDDLDDRFVAMANQDKMYYKIRECFKLAESSEKQYDLVIRIRPDLKINEGTSVDWHDVYEKCSRDNIVYSEAPPLLKENIFVGDQFGASTFELSKIYANTFDFHDFAKEHKILGIPSVRGGHTTLAWSLLSHGIKNEQLKQIKWGGLSDIQKLDSSQIRDLLEKDIGLKGSNFIHQEFLSSLSA